MAISQFNLYDLIVDVIPGTVAILFVLSLLPSQAANSVFNFANIPAGAVVLIIVSYILGRTVHAISGSVSDLIERWSYLTTMNAIKETSNNTIFENINSNPKHFLFLQIRKSLPVERGDITIDKIFNSSQSLNSDLESETDLPIVRVANQVYKSLSKSENNPSYELGVRSNIIRQTGYSLLYSDDNNLYNRYNILTTFFRNIAFLFWVFTLTLALQLLYYNPTITDVYILSSTVEPSYLIPVSSLLLAVLFSREAYKYSDKRNLHFLLNYHRTLEIERTEK